MRHLSIDIETYSSVEIHKAGMYKYAQSPDFEILLFAYSLDGGPVEVWICQPVGMSRRISARRCLTLKRSNTLTMLPLSGIACHAIFI